MKKPAFTLIELIIVITIISILVGFIVVDFRGAIQRQELAVIGDQSFAMMQQARTEVSSGKREYGSEEETKLLCEGGYFEEGEVPLFAVTSYNVESEACDFPALKTEIYGTSTGKVVATNIEVGGSVIKEFWALYEPPNGTSVFYSGAGVRLSGDAMVTIQHETNEDLALSLGIFSKSNQLTLNLPDEKATE